MTATGKVPPVQMGRAIIFDFSSGRKPCNDGSVTIDDELWDLIIRTTLIDMVRESIMTPRTECVTQRSGKAKPGKSRHGRRAR